MDADQKRRAEEALKSRNKNHKRENVLKHMREVRENNTGRGLVTHGIVYNATGKTIKYVGNADFFGKMLEGAAPRNNEEIQNGEWHWFLHKKGDLAGSEGAVIYRVEKKPGEFSDVMLAWDTPAYSEKNKAYTEIREFNHQWNWGAVQKNMEDQPRIKYHKAMAFDDAYQSVVITHKSDKNPIFEGVITVRDATVELW